MGARDWPPSEFWNATVYDIERAMDGWQTANGASTEAETKEDHERRKAFFLSMPDVLE